MTICKLDMAYIFSLRAIIMFSSYFYSLQHQYHQQHQYLQQHHQPRSQTRQLQFAVIEKAFDSVIRRSIKVVAVNLISNPSFAEPPANNVAEMPKKCDVKRRQKDGRDGSDAEKIKR